MNAKRRIRARVQPEKTPDRGICPLCERVFQRADLHVHLTKEPPMTRRQISKAIQAEFSSWRPEDGACLRCWESFRGVARVVNFLTKFKSPTRSIS